MPYLPFFLKLTGIDKDDIEIVGEKAYRLAALSHATNKVPKGFVITSELMRAYLDDNGLFTKITDTIKSLNPDDPDALEAAAQSIQSLIYSKKISVDIEDQLLKHYIDLTNGQKDLGLIVRSSVTTDGHKKNSLSEHHSIFYNVKGDVSFIEHVRRVWASLYSAGALFYMKKEGVEDALNAVVVQVMPNVKSSGKIMTINPATGEKDRIIIEGVEGLYELAIEQQEESDKYILKKDTLEILAREISKQEQAMFWDGAGTKITKSKKGGKPKLNDSLVKTLAKIGVALENHKYFSQEIDWIFDGQDVYIMHSTDLGIPIKPKRIIAKTTKTPIASGEIVKEGIVTAPARIIKSAADLGKVKSGDILVTGELNTQDLFVIKLAIGIVSEGGSANSHSSIFAKDRGLPTIIGAKDATKKIKDGEVITLDATSGKVYFGKKPITPTHKMKESLVFERTATKLYVNISNAEEVEKINQGLVDGIGLVRSEFLILEMGTHPKEIIKNGQSEEFVSTLAQKMINIAKPMNDKPVLYRLSDIRSDEYRNLEGGRFWEPEEINPGLGIRGAARHLIHPDVLSLELEAIKKANSVTKNLNVVIPFLRSPGELRRIKKLIATSGLTDTVGVKLWMMAEVPENAINLKKYLEIGIDGVTIGSSDMTMLLMGADRENANIRNIFDESSPVVFWAIKKIVKKCLKAGVQVSICGQAPSLYDDTVVKLVRLGITSISVNPDSAKRAKLLIAETEKSMLR